MDGGGEPQPAPARKVDAGAAHDAGSSRPVSGSDRVPRHEYEARRAVFHRPWVIAAAIDADEPGAIEAAVSYLEEDPWVFRSGYGKALLLRRMRRAQLADVQRERLQRVLLHYVDVGPRWDFREACSLARVVSDRPFVRELTGRLHGRDLQISLRALIMLLRLRRPGLGEHDLARGREVLTEWAATNRWWHGRQVGGWVRRVWSPAWGAGLVAAADSDDGSAACLAATRILGCVPRLAKRTRETSP